jgi:uncharacterized protein (TIGR02246 family)
MSASHQRVSILNRLGQAQRAMRSIVALYEPEAVMVGPSGPVQGTDAIRERYRNFFAIRPTIDLHTLGVNRAGELAMLHGRWTLRGSAPDGTAIQSGGRNAEVVRQQDDGRWLFVIDNSSVPQE